MGHGQAPDPADPLRALDLRNMADGVENRRLRQAVHDHVQQAGKIGQRAAHSERKNDNAHMFDRGIGEQPLDVAPTVEHERCENEREQTHRHHQGSRSNCRRIGGKQYLEAQQRIERDVQKQARQHGRYRRRPLGMRVGQPRVQRRQADLGPVAENQEYESDVEKGRVEIRRMLDQECPHHAVLTLADHRPRRHVDQDRAEQRESNSDTAQDEIFPRRFQSGVGAIDANHQHRAQRRDFDRNPHQTDIVRHESQIHAEHHGLIHGVVETQVDRGQPPGVEFMRDVARAEDAGREPHEGIEHDEHNIEVVDQHVRRGLRTFDHEQREGRKECRETGGDVQPRRLPVARQDGQQRGRADRNQQDSHHRVEGRYGHRRSPR